MTYIQYILTLKKKGLVHYLFTKEAKPYGFGTSCYNINFELNYPFK